MAIMAEEETDHVKEAPAEFKVRLPYVSPIAAYVSLSAQIMLRLSLAASVAASLLLGQAEAFFQGGRLLTPSRYAALQDLTHDTLLHIEHPGAQHRATHFQSIIC
jgi:hypothetical protein